MILGGPSACGKSALAVALARTLDGEVVNADSIQVYRDLAVLTARPGAEDRARVPHHLYGVLDPDAVMGAGRWLAVLHGLLPEIWARGRVAVVAGGTGLYLRALVRGLAPVPAIPAKVRAAAARDYDRLGAAAFAAELARRDPVSAAAIPAANRQRMIRAMEVVRATGTPISAFQAMPHRGGLPDPPAAVAILPDRDWLFDRCERRFAGMMAAGAADQVADLLARGVSPQAPVFRALGARPLAAMLAGELSRAAAVEAALADTRAYVRRQFTWFRRQFAADLILEPPADDPESEGIGEKVARILASRRGAAHNGVA